MRNSIKQSGDRLVFHQPDLSIGRGLPPLQFQQLSDHRCRLQYRWTCQFCSRRGFAGFSRLAPLETFSRSMRDRKSHAHAPILRDSPISTKTEGLNGGASRIRTLRRLGEWSVSHLKASVWYRQFESTSLRHAICDLPHSPEKLAKFARVRSIKRASPCEKAWISPPSSSSRTCIGSTARLRYCSTSWPTASPMRACC